MRKTGLTLLVLTGFLLPKLGHAQQPQPTPAPLNSTGTIVGNTPTQSDMYCSGYITADNVPDKLFVAGGHNSPDQSRYAGPMDVIFIHGQGMQAGERYQIVRHVRDSNHYEAYRGQRSAVRAAGEPYFEIAIVRIVDVQKNTGIAKFELSCSDVLPGDVAIPLTEREAPPFRNVSLERYTPPNGKTQGRIIMAKEFDTFVGSKYKVYLSIGADKGLKPGDYLRATRTYSATYNDPEAGLSLKASDYEDTQVHPQMLPRGDVSSLPRRTLGDMMVLQVHKHSATAIIVTSLETIQVGDGVELMDVSDAPVLPPIQPSFSNAPEPGANSAANAAPPTIKCAANPTSLRAGESVNVSCEAASPDNRPLNITFVANGGKLSSNHNQATLDTTDTPAGPIAVRATAFDDRQMSASTVVTVNVEAPPSSAPTAQKLMELNFKTGSAYVDNRSKAVLDDVALKVQQDPNLNAVLIGSAEPGEGKTMGLRRAENARDYLVKSKGVNPERLKVEEGTEPGLKVEIWAVPPGATMPGTTPAAQPPQGAAPQDQSAQPAQQPPADQQPPATQQPPANQEAPAADQQPTPVPQPTPPPQ
jgi:outer membrane protein OmpA-like peptidoglycan-associated protein